MYSTLASINSMIIVLLICVVPVVIAMAVLKEVIIDIMKRL